MAHNGSSLDGTHGLCWWRGGGVRSDNLQDFDPLGGEVGSFDFLMINNCLSTGWPHNGSSLWPLLN